MAEKISADRERKYKQGKIIVPVLMVFEIIATVISFIFRFNTFGLCITVSTFILVFKGDPWARYLFLFDSVVSTALFLCVISLEYFAELTFYLVLFAYVVRFVGGLLLAFNSYVKEYLYSRYAG